MKRITHAVLICFFMLFARSIYAQGLEPPLLPGAAPPIPSAPATGTASPPAATMREGTHKPVDPPVPPEHWRDRVPARVEPRGDLHYTPQVVNSSLGPVQLSRVLKTPPHSSKFFPP